MTETPSSFPVAVIGATGQQGSATVDALLRRGLAVRALCRDTGGEAAKALTARGATVAPIDLEEAASVRDAFTGVAAVFAMTTFTGPGGTDGETANGRVIVEAAREAAVPFVVYSSVGGAERDSGVPHFESKRLVEEAFDAAAVPSTFVRPTFFMENLLGMIERDGDAVTVTAPFPDDIPLQMVSVRDIGEVSAALLAAADPGAAPVEIAGDERTGSQIADAVGRRLGVAGRYVAAPLDVLGDDDQETMFAWFTRLPAYQADFDRTRELSPEVETLDRWLERQDLA